MSLTIVGTIAYDTIEAPAGKRDKILGGSATFAGVAASLFAKTHLVSIVGRDFKPEYLAFLQERGLDISGVSIQDGETFHWHGYYKDDLNQAYTLKTELNLLLQFKPVLPAAAQQAKVLFLANVDPLLQSEAIAQTRNRPLIVLDTMNYWIENKREALKTALTQTDVLIINDQEVRLLTGCSNIIEALPAVLALGPRRVIVKKGEHGSLMFNGQDYFLCPAMPLAKLIDPTGAGDSFAGSFCGYLAAQEALNEDTFRQAMLLGTLTSYFTVQGFSLDRLKMLTKEELQSQYRRYYQYTQLPSMLSF